MKTAKLLLTAAMMTFTTSQALAYDASWDGNHPDSKSEAWTWMGHVQEVTGQGSSLRLTDTGYGFIYYYTRNDEGSMGSMNFRSSAVTTTKAGVGQSYDTHTIYAAKYPGSELRTRAGVLDISFHAGTMDDVVQAQSMTAADQAKLAQVMALYPGLHIAPGVAPKKTHFHEVEENGDVMDLDFYAIWPVISPENGQLTFLGQKGTYEFSEPMLVTTGTRNGKPVAGLSFSDFQWAKEYFGTYVMSGLSDLMKYANALNYAHAWSAFHVYNPRTQEWSFFHVWHQWKRADGVVDQLTDDSTLRYIKNGTEVGEVSPDAYVWTPSGFVEEKGADVMLAYAMGRKGFFPSRADLAAPTIGFSAKIAAAPALQALNQPIYFYEGYASGQGTWNGDAVQIQGRLESSHLMFRTQDYQEMLTILQAKKSQPKLQKWLEARIAEDQAPDTPFAWVGQQLAVLAGMMSDMDLKLAVFGTIMNGSTGTVDPDDANVMIYK